MQYATLTRSGPNVEAKYAVCNFDQVRTEVDLANDDQLELVVAMTCGRLLRLQP